MEELKQCEDKRMWTLAEEHAYKEQLKQREQPVEDIKLMQTEHHAESLHLMEQQMETLIDLVKNGQWHMSDQTYVSF